MRKKNKILQEDKKYTFRDYFDLKYPTDEILVELSYDYRLMSLTLPSRQIDSLTHLQSAMIQRLPKVSLTSETARREFYLSPFFLDLLDRLDFRLNIEYPIDVNDYLRGVVDYLLRSTHNIIVVEAKNADMERGFTQLAVELIAVSEYLENISSQIYGAITTGNLWQFGMLEVTEKMITKDLNQFLLPDHVDKLGSIFAGILSNGNQVS